MNIQTVNGEELVRGEQLELGAEVTLTNGTHAVIVRWEEDFRFKGDECIYFARVELRTMKGNLITVVF